MAISRQRRARFSPDLSFVLLTALLAILLLTGGASREDVSGQILSRGAAWIAIVVAALFARRPRIAEAKGAALLLGALILLCVAQLIPLPPSIWHALPGRAAFIDPLISPPYLWRPWSLVPGATVNALFSLVVPLAVLVLASGMREKQKSWIPVAVLAIIALSLLVGLLQFTGAGIVNPFVNGTPGAVDGMIANRNHFALFLAIGLLIAPVWGVGAGNASRLRAPIALGFVLLLVLTILASGSRAGIALGVVALALGFAMSRRGMKSALRRYPRWTFPAIGAGIVALIAMFVLASFATGRAVSIDRIVSDDAGADMRVRGLPIVLAMIHTYFPFGSGIGSFDPIFRMHEPFALLKPTYFNHAHNDFLEIVLTAGLPGLLLLVAAITWWGWRSLAAWQGESVLPKLGSSTLLLILLASAVDYPARTPIIMAITTIAAIWLGGAGRGGEDEDGITSEASLPSTGRKL
ncbi:O-antigen ligase family protein [uncultured Sphingomonas sp.]|uniref:O-antigen ligase family protein n=1 Tax=uncultured Sphingomonas sp. TaxID=158754 RepID=UPI0025929E10|nr:O-antigen ligase family protein [uncultured Sphingomonas sp.]